MLNRPTMYRGVPETLAHNIYPEADVLLEH